MRAVVSEAGEVSGLNRVQIADIEAGRGKGSVETVRERLRAGSVRKGLGEVEGADCCGGSGAGLVVMGLERR